MYVNTPMPRPNSLKHVITQAREILGLTRPELAERIGISRVYLEKLERGEQKLPLKIAFRIREITQVDIAQLMAGDKGRPVDGTGRTITKEFVNEVNVLREKIPIERVDRTVSSLCYRLEMLLDAGALSDPERFSVLEWALWGAFEEIEKEFDMSRPISAIRKGYERAFVEAGMRESRAKLWFAPNTFPVMNPKDAKIKNEHRKLRYEARAAKTKSRSTEKT